MVVLSVSRKGVTVNDSEKAHITHAYRTIEQYVSFHEFQRCIFDLVGRLIPQIPHS